jgi:hypothetical protein
MEAETRRDLLSPKPQGWVTPPFARELGAVRLQDEHPPIAHIFGRHRCLLTHDLVEARHSVHLLCHHPRIINDTPARGGELCSRGKVGWHIENG